MTQLFSRTKTTTPSESGLSFSSVIRWILLIPAAVVLTFLLILVQSFIFIWLGTTWFVDASATHPEMFSILRNLTYGAGFVFFGTWVAPKSKLKVATILTGIICTLVGVRVLGTLMIGNGFSDWSSNSLRVGAALLAWYYFSRSSSKSSGHNLEQVRN